MQLNPFEMAQRQFDACAEFLNLDPNVRAILREPMREVTVSIPVRMDDGSVQVFKGFRVLHNDVLGPGKGGIRFHPEENLDTVKALATWMTWKASLLNLPLGGGKGGVICDTKGMSQGEIERLSRGYINRLWQVLGPEVDIPAPDVYTNPQVMAWMMDEYSRIIGKNQFGVITGKPPQIGGSLGRGDATARGGMFTMREAAKVRGIDLSKAELAIQGYGNAGYHAARLAEELFGSRVVAVSDSKGGIYKKDGLDSKELYDFKAKTGTVVGFPGSTNILHDDLLGLDVDAIIPAALENAINASNAGKIKASMVVELANGPTTPEADDILYANNVHVIPDFLCNAGGVTVSYFEMVQNFSMYYWDEKEVQSRLDAKITSAYHDVLGASLEYKTHMRQAAYIVAVKRVETAMRLRGWV